MAKPATLPTHATDTNYTNGPESGSPTKETPPAGYLAEGYIPGDKFFSQFTNWILYWLCQWIAWFDRPVVQKISLHGRITNGVGAVQPVAANAAALSSNNAAYYLHLHELRPGFDWTGARVRVNPSDSLSAVNMTAQAYRRNVEADTLTAISSLETSSGTGAQTLVLDTFSNNTIDDSGTYYYYILFGSTDGAASASDFIDWVEVTC